MKAPLLPAHAPPLSMHLQGLDGKARRFWSYARHGKRLDLHHGAVGTEGKHESRTFASPEEATAFAHKNVATRVAKGYFTSALPFESVAWSQVRSEVKVVGNSEQDSDRVLVLTGDVTVPHNLWLDSRRGLLALEDESAPPFAGLIVRGNLTIQGSLLNQEDDFGPFLLVHGNLVARSIATGGSQIRIHGDVTTEALVGVYNHGSLCVGGHLVARIVASEHALHVDGAIDAYRYRTWGSKVFPVVSGVEDEQQPHEAKGVFVPAMVKAERIDLSKARELLAEGKPICLPEFTSVKAAFRKLVAKKLAEPDKVKSLTLKSKDLASLPEDLFQFRRLEKLDLTHNRLRTLPEELGQLTELRELRLRGNGLRTLPESIGALTNLRVLDLEANCIWSIPDSLARCVELRTVNLTNNPYAYVREAFGGWQHVKWMRDFPDVFTRLPRLEALTFDGTLLRTLPTRRFDSTALRKVTVHKSLVTQMDPELHSQLSVDTKKSASWAVDHIRFWFASDTIHLETFFSAKTGRYDFTEVVALLGILLDITVPTAAPYDAALREFTKQSKDIAHRLDWTGKNGPHVRALFGALRDALGPFGKSSPDNALIQGLGKVFALHAG